MSSRKIPIIGYSDYPIVESTPHFKYLIQQGITLDEMKKFRVGFAQPLHHEIERLKNKDIILEYYWDKKLIPSYIDRAMFPFIHLETNKILGFAMLELKQNSPFWFYSRETYHFSHSETLFGLSVANHNKQDTIIVTDDFINVIKGNRAFPTVAPINLLSEKSANIIKKMGFKSILIAVSDKGEITDKFVSEAVKSCSEVGLQYKIKIKRGDIEK